MLQLQHRKSNQQGRIKTRPYIIIAILPCLWMRNLLSCVLCTISFLTELVARSNCVFFLPKLSCKLVSCLSWAVM